VKILQKSFDFSKTFEVDQNRAFFGFGAGLWPGEASVLPTQF
jgi:hypothetical protein